MHDQWFANFLKDKTQKLYLIKYDGKYVGCIGLVIEKDKLPEISRVLLADRRYARQGLMSEALSRLTNKYTPCYLQVRADNLRAIQFYLKNGFTIKPNSETVRNGITIINMIKEH
jgi:RimJ/RimL family protein N-acetyltransferase